MNFKSLENYVSIVKNGSINAASQELFVTQQALSDSLSKLEKEIGAPLVERVRPMKPTVAGAILYDGAKKIIHTRDRMLKDIQRAVEGEKKRIYIGEVDTELNSIFPSIILSYCSLCPDYEIIVQNYYSSNQDEYPDDMFLLLNSASTPLKNPNQFNRINLLSSSQYAILVQKKILQKVWDIDYDGSFPLSNIKIRLSSMSELPFLIHKDESGIDDLKTRNLFDLAGFDPKITFRTERQGLLIDMCIHGLGAYIGPYYQCRAILNARGQVDSLKDMVLLPVDIPNSEKIEIDLLYSKEHVINDSEETFISLVKDFFSILAYPE